MATELIHVLSLEDLARYRMIRARLEAVSMNPAVFSQAETIEAILARWKFEGDLEARLGIPPQRQWSMSAVNGAVIYGTDWEE